MLNFTSNKKFSGIIILSPIILFSEFLLLKLACELILNY